MKKNLSLKQQEIIILKLKKIIGKESKRMYPEKDILIENARIKNITQGIAAYGAQPQNFIGMLTITIAGKENRILPLDDLETIKNKTKIAYDSMLFYFDKLRRFLKQRNYELIYLMNFELQKDGNLHSHIYFSIPLKAFGDFFQFYHKYNKNFTNTKIKKIKVGKNLKTITPIGRSQLGISSVFLKKLEQNGFKFKAYSNPQKPDRIDWRCINFVSELEFKSGNWPTLYFYSKKDFEKKYSQKIIKYLTKVYSKPKRQKAIGSEFIKHNGKSIYESEEWSEIQKKFIRKICHKIYTASRLPIPIAKYQKKRNTIIKIYPTYANYNTLITDYLNAKANYANEILTCPNGKKIKF